MSVNKYITPMGSAYTHNVLKTVEELSELSAILMQSINKKKPPTPDRIIEEIGDVRFRLILLSQFFDKEKIKERVEYKSSKHISNIE